MIITLLEGILGNLKIPFETIQLEYPADMEHGDFSTNIALACAKKAGVNPRELAEKIVAEIEKNKPVDITKMEVAGPGFINFYLAPQFFAGTIGQIVKEGKEFGKNESLKGKKVMVEYTQPNPFKPFHIGHLMSNAVGESLARLVEWSGAKTVRANYQGDVGPHVAKAIYILLKNPAPAELTTASSQAEYIGKCYSQGSQAYEEDPETKKEIDAINKKIYEKSDEEINKVYDWGRKVTLDAFEELYAILGTKFDYYFFESEMAPIGQKIVQENVGPVFEESDGAIVFKADKYDPKLHTRVFINSQGLPTYETKEIGLTMTKFAKEQNLDLSIVDTAVEQAEYMKVVEKAMSLLKPEYAEKMKHITHGMMRFAEGKMSSRKGNIITGESLVRDSKAMIMEKIADRDFTAEEKETVSAIVGVGALKYSILRQAVGGDIIYDFEKSISFEGDSGPYLQYSATRVKSVLAKAQNEKVSVDASLPKEWQTTVLERLLSRFPDTALRASREYAPHHIASYLGSLARAWSSFYDSTKILDDSDATPYKLSLATAVGTVLESGLALLGITAPERM